MAGWGWSARPGLAGLRQRRGRLERGAAAGAEWLTTEQVNQLVPGLARASSGCPVRHQARVNPLRAIARARGRAPYVGSGVAVQAVKAEHGRVATVVTTAGEFQPGVVVFATGTPPRLDGLELDSRRRGQGAYASRPSRRTLRLPGSVASVATTIDDGRLLIGGTLDLGDDERVVRPRSIAAMRADLESAWPPCHGRPHLPPVGVLRPLTPTTCRHRPHPVAQQRLVDVWPLQDRHLMAPATGRALADRIRSGQRPARRRPRPRPLPRARRRLSSPHRAIAARSAATAASGLSIGTATSRTSSWWRRSQASRISRSSSSSRLTCVARPRRQYARRSRWRRCDGVARTGTDTSSISRPARTSSSRTRSGCRSGVTSTTLRSENAASRCCTPIDLLEVANTVAQLGGLLEAQLLAQLVAALRRRVPAPRVLAAQHPHALGRPPRGTRSATPRRRTAPGTSSSPAARTPPARAAAVRCTAAARAVRSETPPPTTTTAARRNGPKYSVPSARSLARRLRGADADRPRRP